MSLAFSSLLFSFKKTNVKAATKIRSLNPNLFLDLMPSRSKPTSRLRPM